MKARGFTPIKLAQDQEPSDLIKPSLTIEIREIQDIITYHFDAIEDSRIEQTKKHLLKEILTITILAVIAGARAWEDIENYGISKEKWLAEFLTLPHGIPSDDTLIAATKNSTEL